jgi:threonine dehydratase
MPINITRHEIDEARSIVDKYLISTPLIYSPEFSGATGNEVFFKLESLQRTHAFKVRGALNKLMHLTALDRQNGVIAASSGNHALGVSYSAALLGMDATVIMPVNAPDAKRDRATAYGAKVILQGNTYDQALDYAKKFAARSGKALLPSFDDPYVIAGQGTIALEVLDCYPEVDTFLAPIGGGGLVSGLAIALSAVGHSAMVIGVQADGAASMYKSLEAGHRVKLSEIHTIADGIAVQQPGEITFDLIQRYAITVRLVDDFQIIEAMARLIHDAGIIVEPAAAAPVAALLFDEALKDRGWKVCCVITGANISNNLLQEITKVRRFNES